MSTGLAPNSPSADPAHGDWMVHFVSARNPRDRDLDEHEGCIYLPTDFELSEGADEFEVLCRQIILGGLIPGWPDGIFTTFSPLASIVAQSVATVDFERRSTLCGVVVSRSDLEKAGAFADIIPGRPDFEFDDFLAWDVRSGSASPIDFRWPPEGEYRAMLGLPLFMSGSPFRSIGVMVDDDEQAEIIQGILTWDFLGLRGGLPDHRFRRRQLLNTFVLAPGHDVNDGRSDRGLKGLEGFVPRPAVLPSREQLRIKVRLERAMRVANDAIAPYIYPLGPQQSPSYLAFAAGSDDVSRFLTNTSWASFAERGAVPGDWRLALDIEADCPYLDVAAASLTSALGLDFYVVEGREDRP